MGLVLIVVFAKREKSLYFRTFNSVVAEEILKFDTCNSVVAEQFNGWQV